MSPRVLDKNKQKEKHKPMKTKGDKREIRTN